MLLAFAVPSPAVQVYSGCSSPPATSRHVWYIDPVNGKSPAAGGNGSQADPWNSLTGVIGGTWATTGFTVPGYMRPLLSSVPYAHFINRKFVDVADHVGNPPIQPGDTIYLMSGNYGDIVLGSYDLSTVNSDWVTVQAAPGQTPVFTTLTISRTNKWLFEGIKVQSIFGTNNNTNWFLVTVSDQGATYPTQDIALDGLDVSSADHSVTVGWTQAVWKANARSGVNFVGTPGSGTNGEPYTTCISLTNSRVHDVYVGVGLFANQSLIANNEIDHFTADGLDYGANYIAITHNFEHDNQTIDANHEDAMQGQVGPLLAGVAFNAFSNILIDSNLILRQTDPSLQFPSYLQGIDVFDEDWTNVTVTNNVVVTSSCYGILFKSVHNSLIAKNTVVNDGLISTPGCVPAIDAGGTTHEGPLSTNTVVQNNLTSQLNVDTRAIGGIVADHNVVLCCGPGPFIGWYVNGVIQYLSKPGTYANGNVIESQGPKGEFINFDPVGLTFNVMLKPGAQAIRLGSAAGPPIDILGYTRAFPYTVGAYSYPR
jgi:Right handed beta helix region